MCIARGKTPQPWKIVRAISKQSAQLSQSDRSRFCTFCSVSRKLPRITIASGACVETYILINVRIYRDARIVRETAKVSKCIYARDPTREIGITAGTCALLHRVAFGINDFEFGELSANFSRLDQFIKLSSSHFLSCHACHPEIFATKRRG